jgi:hypothetical protein
VSVARRAATGVAAVALAAAAAGSLAAPPAGCALLLSDHRSGEPLARVPLPAAEPALRVAFTHSVLGTPVEDRYVFRPGPDGWHAVLVEERWQGEGYGLPIEAGAGERLERDGDGWRLRLARVVHPLVVLALPSQRMRVIVDGRPPILLGSLATPAPVSVALRVEGCDTVPKEPA